MAAPGPLTSSRRAHRALVRRWGGARCTCDRSRLLEGTKPVEITARFTSVMPNGTEVVEQWTRTNIEIARDTEQRRCEARAQRWAAQYGAERRARIERARRLAAQRATQRIAVATHDALPSDTGRESRGTSHSSRRPASRDAGGGATGDASGGSDGGAPPPPRDAARLNRAVVGAAFANT